MLMILIAALWHYQIITDILGNVCFYNIAVQWQTKMKEKAIPHTGRAVNHLCDTYCDEVTV